jgi:uncharacterized protein YfaT (DUF1175 family)
MDGRRRLIAAAVVGLVLSRAGAAQVRLTDEGDREAFRAWFTFMADAQFYRPAAGVADCAGLVRHATREALRAHTPEWHRLAALPAEAPYPDVRSRPAGTAGGWPLFRVGRGRYAEFADARTIVTLNAKRTSRDARSLRPGDLLYFRQDGQRSPDHLMVFIGASRFDASARDWVVYHTGPLDGGPGEVRKARLADLMRHPAARWRPVAHNPAFVGVFRLDWL